MNKKSEKKSSTGGKRTQKVEKIIREITSMKQVAQGSVSVRTRSCGKASCRCATDPDARHGPYYEWMRREDGRYVNTLISPEQAKELRVAIDNHQRILELLRLWSAETARELKIKKKRK